MGYKVVKVLNNNAILAQEQSGTQIVLMSKGIGFGKKPGESVDEDREDQKVFYILDSSGNVSKLRQLSFEEDKVGQVTQEIVEIAAKKLNIENGNLYGALLDHITFAIECLQMDLPIDNPFLSEISILYREEYDTAQIAAGIIKERMGVEIGEAETGFIALHLYSARQNRHIRSAMKNTRVYSEILTMVAKYANKDFDSFSAEAGGFLLSLNQLVENAARGTEAPMLLKMQVKYIIPLCWEVAEKIGKVVKKELDITLGEDTLAFIAVDIHKLLST